jgi:hypothetical protein
MKSPPIARRAFLYSPTQLASSGDFDLLVHFESRRTGDLDEARTVMSRYADFWNTQTIKQYHAGVRHVRQAIVATAAERELTPNQFQLQGRSHADHRWVSVARAQLSDVSMVRGRRQATSKEWYDHVSHRIGRFVPHGVRFFYKRHVGRDVKQKAERFGPRTNMRKLWDDIVVRANPNYLFPRKAAGLATIVKAGGKISFGSHSGVGGEVAHVELWTMASGGLPVHDLLRAATIWSAESIGLDQDLGSIEVGKLADLQILTRNPLIDVFQTTSIVQVMKNGRLYDATTLDEVWPRKRSLPRQWWWK